MNTEIMIMNILMSQRGKRRGDKANGLQGVYIHGKSKL